MRRTEQEFKAEILRRSEAYRRKRAEKRKKVIGAGICACLCIAVLAVFIPMGGASSDNAAPAADMLTMGQYKSEESMMQSPECAPDYAMDGATPIENEAAAGEPNESLAGEAAEVEIVVGEEVFVLNAADSAAIMEYLSGEWIMSAANCLCDYTLRVNGMTYRYHSDCGTIQDESCHSLTLEDTDRLNVNEILGSYIG